MTHPFLAPGATEPRLRSTLTGMDARIRGGCAPSGFTCAAEELLSPAVALLQEQRGLHMLQTGCCPKSSPFRSEVGGQACLPLQVLARQQETVPLRDRDVWSPCLMRARHLTSAGLPVSLKVPLFQGCWPCDMNPGPSSDRPASSVPPSASSLASAITCTQLPL